MTPVPPATLGEFLTSHEYAGLPALPHGAVTVVVIRDYVDRPVSGLAMYEGESYWFETYFDDALDDYPHPRPYVLARVPQSFIDDELFWHRRYLEDVWDVRVTPPVLRSEASREQYFQDREARVVPDLDDAPLIGWTFLPDAQP